MTTFKDSKGNEASHSEVVSWARENVRASMSFNELLNYYLSDLNNQELVEWAEDENGEFPKEIE